MQTGLADKLTEWAIYALRQYATLPFDLQIVPFAGSDAAENERLVVKMDVGAKMDSGPEPYQCAASFSFHTVNRSAEEANDVFAKTQAALVDSLQNATGVTFASTLLTFLQMFPEEAETSLENSGNFRVYTRTIPLRAL